MKWIKSLAAILVAIFVLVIVDINYSSISTLANDGSSIVDEVIFPHNEVVDVNIVIDEEVYQNMLDTATEEEVVMADITYNGYTFSDIGIRTKGNSSLRDVANSDSDRYSFKVDFNYYLEDQDFYGITKINLNNIFSDPSMMAEYLGYEMLDELDEVSPRTTYVALSINGEYFGLYLAAEQVNSSFLTDHYGDDSGELYKPDSGVGSDLAYISDDGADYSGMFPENMDESDNEDLVKLIMAIEDGSDLDSVLNVDSFLKYLAVSTMTVHLDSYQGAMFHNYYLYNNEGIFEWIPWDLNMIFNGFPGSGLTDEDAIEFLIDEPVKGEMSNYPLVEAIFENEEYVAKYHEYLVEISEGYFEEDAINEKVLSIYNMIKDYVKIDPSSFYTYDEFETALFEDEGTSVGLLSFVQQRVENVAQQLAGEIPSTNDGQGNSGSSGNMTQGQGMKGQMMGEMTTDAEMPEMVDGEMPEMVDGEMPEMVDGEMPEMVDGERPEMEEGQMQGGEVDQLTAGDNSEVVDSTTSESNVFVIFGLAVVMVLASIYLMKKH